MDIKINNKLSHLLTIILISISLPVLFIDNGLTQAKSSNNIDTYLEQLEHNPDWQKRSQAALALGEQPENQSSVVIAALIKALEDQDEIVRLRATFALIKIGKPAIPDLINSLNNDREEVRASAIFALRQLGFDIAPNLIKELDNREITAEIVTIFAGMATDIQNRPFSQRPSIDELKQNTEFLETTLQKIKLLSPNGTGLPNPNNLQYNQLGIQQQDIQTIQDSLISFNAEIKSYNQQIILRITFYIIMVLLLSSVLILWRYPKLLLNLSQKIVRSQENNQINNQLLAQIEQFFKQAQVTTNREGNKFLKINSASGRLNKYLPLPVMLATEPSVPEDVNELVKYAAKLTKNKLQQAGILVYREPPDTLVRMRMAEVRLRDKFVLIPIPLAAMEQALLDSEAVTGLLAQYCDRYLPGADLFDDRNAIGDTLSFFGRSELIQNLEEDLQRSQGIGLFGLRKSGKTSLLLQLGFVMRSHPIVHIDLQPYGGKLYYGAELLNQILIKLSQLIKEHNPKSNLNPQLLPTDQPASALTSDFRHQIDQILPLLQTADYQLPILLFLDEIERILPTTTDSKERAEEFNAFFGVLRALSQEKRYLSVLIADVHADANRINQWTQEGVPTNPVYSFFKEIFVFPFTIEETQRMLTDIGELMGVKFEQETLTAIHKLSGGHPFVSRQLASLLNQKITIESNQVITYTQAQRYLEKTFTYSGILKDYFAQNIWGDLEKRNFTSAMMILKLLACHQDIITGITQEKLLTKLNQELTESQCLDALLWLEAVGLIEHQEVAEHDYYQIKVNLMSRWLMMQMKEEEIKQWQL